MTVEEPAKRKPSRRRFTTREAVLTLIVIGLLAVLAVEHQPWTKACWSEYFDASEFMNELTQIEKHEEDVGDGHVLTQVCDRLVDKGKAECSTNGFGGSAGPHQIAQYHATFRLRTPGVRPAKVVGEFRREVEKRLTEHGFSFGGGHATVDTDDNRGFNVIYKKDRIRGFLYVYPFVAERFDPVKDAWRLEVVVLEHRKGGHLGW